MTGFAYPVAMAITPRGTRVFVVNANSASVSIIDTATHTVIERTAVGSLPTSVAISADGTEAFVTNEFGFSLSVLSTSSGAVLKTIPRIGVYPTHVATLP